MDKPSFVLTLIENTGIQDYIFATNNLGVNLGASELVERVTSEWLIEALPSPHNLVWKNQQLEYTDGKIEDGMLKAEVIYRGGGNALILFASEAAAKDCISNLTTAALSQAPGLQIVAAHRPFDLQSTTLAGALKALRKDLARRKTNRALSTPLQGLGVTAACVFTGQPAQRYIKTNPAEENKRYVSAEVAAKLNASEASKERLHRLLPEVREKNYLFMYDFDQFGTHGESSYIAVVHADGNKMGDRIEALLVNASTPEQNRNAVNRLRDFSISVQEAANFALKETVHLLISTRDDQDLSWHRPGVAAAAAELKVVTAYLDRAKRQPLLPFRPIVFGGDDVTFITDGRLGLALAHHYLSACARQNLADGQPFYSRAGMAVVKTHYPFSRAYDLADALTKSAKDWKDYPKVPSLDWHFATVGLVEDLATIRAKSTIQESGDLLYMRPLRLDAPSTEWRTWSKFRQVMDDFQQKPEWKERRNKIMALREALRDGASAVGQFLSYYCPDSPALPIYDSTLPDLHKKGAAEGRCGYFDPIEALDFFIPLGG